MTNNVGLTFSVGDTIPRCTISIVELVTLNILFRATLHTRLRSRGHDTSSTLIVEKAELVQVRFTLSLRDQRSIYVNAKWM